MKVNDRFRDTADQILKVFHRRGRGLLVVPTGFDSRSFLSKALETTKSQIIAVNLKGVKTSKDVDRIFSEIGPQRYNGFGALNRLGRRSATTLLIENLDAISETGDEEFLLGDFRGQLQFMDTLSVFFTVADANFVTRMVGPRAAFNGIHIIQPSMLPDPPRSFGDSRNP
jgi:hypothetical protein